MLDLAGANQPDELPGHSLLPGLRGESLDRPWPIYWQFNRSKAIRDREWKLVKYGDQDWELYNVADEPTELTDLADAKPDQVKLLADQWTRWWNSK